MRGKWAWTVKLRKSKSGMLGILYELVKGCFCDGSLKKIFVLCSLLVSGCACSWRWGKSYGGERMIRGEEQCLGEK